VTVFALICLMPAADADGLVVRQHRSPLFLIGISRIKAKTVHFRRLRLPLEAGRRAKSPAGAVHDHRRRSRPAVNIKGVQPGQLVLDGRHNDRLYYPGWITKVGRSQDQEAESQASAPAWARRLRRSIVHGRLRNQLPVSRLPLEGRARSSRTHVRCRHLRAVAFGHRPKGNEGEANMVSRPDGRHRLGRLRRKTAYAKQNKNVVHSLLVNKDGTAVSPSGRSFAPLPPTA